MKYNNVDPVFLKKFWDILGRLNRNVEKRYSNSLCEKEVFVRRTLRKWISGKSFMVIVHEPTGIYTYESGDSYSHNPYDSKEIKRPKKHYVCVSGCDFYLGYQDDIVIHYADACSSLAINSKQFNFSQLMRFDYVEISKDEFMHVYSLFQDDREPKEFTMMACTKTKKVKKLDVVVTGRDYQEARDNAIKQYPDYVIYG